MGSRVGKWTVVGSLVMDCWSQMRCEWVHCWTEVSCGGSSRLPSSREARWSGPHGIGENGEKDARYVILDECLAKTKMEEFNRKGGEGFKEEGEKGGMVMRQTSGARQLEINCRCE